MDLSQWPDRVSRWQLQIDRETASLPRWDRLIQALFGDPGDRESLSQ